MIAAGTWRESVVIDQRIELIGNGEVSWEPAAGRACVVLRADACLVGIHFGSRSDGRGCVIVDASCSPQLRGCSFSAEAGDAITVRAGALRIRSSEIRRAGSIGALIESGAALFASDLRVADCAEAGIATRGGGVLERVSVTRAGQVGIAIGRGGSPRLVDCSVSECGRCGVSIVGDSRPEIHAIEVHGCETALWAGHDARAFVRNTTVRTSESGIVVTDAAELTLHDARVEGSRHEGIILRDRSALTGARVEVRQNAGVAVGATDHASLGLATLRIHTLDAARALQLQRRATAVLMDLEVTALGAHGVAVEDQADLTVERGWLRHRTAPLTYAETARVSLEGCSVETLGAHAVSDSVAAARFAAAPLDDSARTAVTDDPRVGDDPIAWPPATEGTATVVDDRSSVPDELELAIAHLRSHGAVSEADLIRMLGARKARAFARRCEALTVGLPFRVRIEILPGGQKVYVRDGGR